MYCNNDLKGKYMAIVGRKLSGPPRDPKCRSPEYRGITVLDCRNCEDETLRYTESNNVPICF
jgi:hypothetical protein